MILENKIPFKYLFSIVKYELVAVVLVAYLSHLLSSKLITGFPDMPLAMPAFLGTSISVLLSFKMNQSYDRWWEARKAWGSIVNDSRSLLLQLQTFLTEGREEDLEAVGFRQVALCYVMGRSLRSQPVTENIGHLLTAEEIEEISGRNNAGLAILQMNSLHLKRMRANAKIGVHEHVQMQETLGKLTDSVGALERINRTVFPSTYRLVLHYIIYLFIITLAISLKEISYYLVMPLLLFVSAGFLFIEKIAYQLQDPFRNRPSDVPVTNIAETFERDAMDLLGLQRKKAPSKQTYYQM